jgi:hypothetical protein
LNCTLRDRPRVSDDAARAARNRDIEKPMNENKPTRLRLVSMSLTLEEAALMLKWGSARKELSGDGWRAEEQALLNRLRKASASA